MTKPISYDDDDAPEQDERDMRKIAVYDDEALKMMQGWTGGQDDPLYAISSTGGWNYAWVFEDAIVNIDRDLRSVKKLGKNKFQLGKGTFTKAEIDELSYIRDALQMALDDPDSELVDEGVGEERRRKKTRLAESSLQLDTIKILFRAPDTMALYGLPYEMRPGQQPGDLWRAGNTKGWIWLGSPGWWGNMSPEDQAAVQVFLRQHHNTVPGGPYEWDRINDETHLEEAHRVADFNTMDDLIAHARDELGATHVAFIDDETHLYFKRADGAYEKAEVWQKDSYWHAQGPGSRAVVRNLPADARPIGGGRRPAEHVSARRGETRKYWIVEQEQYGLWVQVGHFYWKGAAERFKKTVPGRVQVVHAYPSTHDHPVLRVGHAITREPSTTHVRDYIAVDTRGRTIAGPFKSFSDAKGAAGPGGHVKYVRPARSNEARRRPKARRSARRKR